VGRKAIYQITPSALPLTARQSEVLSFMWSFYHSNDQLPTLEDICGQFKWFPNAAREHVMALARKGYVERNACPGRFKFTSKARELLAAPSPPPA
jgi:DNA-binding IclR family transcriptional regulator